MLLRNLLHAAGSGTTSRGPLFARGLEDGAVGEEGTRAAVRILFAGGRRQAGAAGFGGLVPQAESRGIETVGKLAHPAAGESQHCIARQGVIAVAEKISFFGW